MCHQMCLLAGIGSNRALTCSPPEYPGVDLLGPEAWWEFPKALIVVVKLEAVLVVNPCRVCARTLLPCCKGLSDSGLGPAAGVLGRAKLCLGREA